MHKQRRRRLILGIAVAALSLPALTLPALAPGLAAAASTAAAARHEVDAGRSGTGAMLAGAEARDGSLSPAQYPSVPGRFYHVAATSADDVWAVGLPYASIWHWNGFTWVSYPMSQNFLGVSAVSPTDAWAVGPSSWFYPTQTVAYHWNGEDWSQVPTPTPGGSAFFTAVAATSATNAWAVGSISGGPGDTGNAVPLIEQWNGKTWTQQSFSLPASSAQFTGVAATSASNAWAVGWTGAQAPQDALIEHWNGKKWQRIPANSPHGYGYLQGVAASGPDNVWAVGFNDSGPVYKSLILHWNGKRWCVVPSPNPTGVTNLVGVSASSSTNAWAVGYSNTSCPCVTAAFHWNGKQWSVAPAVNPPDSSIDALLGVVAISPEDAWAVGATDWSSTIIEHWDGKAWNT
jgi:hypothetical protein